MPETGFFVISNYEDLKTVLSDPATFSNDIMVEQIGLDSGEISTFKRWSDGMLAPAMGLLVDEASAKHYAEVEAEAQHYLANLFEERRANPSDDILSALLADSADGDEPLTMAELQNLMNQLITGGYTTTADSIGNAMLLLLENPDQMELLSNDRSLLHNFADEALRHASSVQGLLRRATVDTELSGVPIPANSILHTRYGSANWDTTVFAEPERFDITRGNASKHLSFSRGPHFCVGQPLAIQEMMIASGPLIESERLTSVGTTD